MEMSLEVKKDREWLDLELQLPQTSTIAMPRNPLSKKHPAMDSVLLKEPRVLQRLDKPQVPELMR